MVYLSVSVHSFKSIPVEFISLRTDQEITFMNDVTVDSGKELVRLIM